MKANHVYSILYFLMTIGLMFLYSIGGYTASENIVIGTMFVCLNMFMLAQEILDKIESSK